MKSVYTTLSPAEVRSEILKVANYSSLEHDIKLKCSALGLSIEDIHAKPAAKVANFLAYIENHVA